MSFFLYCSVWLADSIYFDHLKIKRGDFGKCLVVTDLFSKKVYARMIKSLQTAHVTAAFEEILREAGTKPVKLGTDRGTEFLSHKFLNCLKSHNIEHYTSNDPVIKMSPVERVIRTLKLMLHKALTADKEGRNYLELFPTIVYNYNNRRHRSLPKQVPTPASVNESNRNIVHDFLYGRRRRQMRKKWSNFELDLGDNVRISMKKTLGNKESKLGNWSLEIFTVTRRW